LTRFLIPITCLTILVAGCSEKQIEVQVVPVEQSSYAVFRPKPSTPAAQGPQRMVVGMFDRPEATWFFKAIGSQEIVDANQKQIFELLRGVTFEQDEPKWEQPTGWTVGPKKTSMFAPLATLIIDADSQTKLTISSLGPNQSLLDNANRWRGQLGLAAITQEQIDTEFAKADGDEFYLFDATGKGSGKMPSAPFANAPFLQRQAMQAEKQKASPSTGAGSGLQYDSPAGWTESQSSGTVPSTRFTKETTAESEKPTLITFTKMSAAANTWTSNAQRWAGQAGQTFTDAELAAATEELKIGGQPSQLIELLDGESGLAIVAVMAVDGQNAWFFKLAGDKESVTEELPTFRKLLSTLKFN